LEEMVSDEEGGIRMEDAEKAVVELGVKYRLASKHTSFVGVDDKDSDGKFEPAMNTRCLSYQKFQIFGYKYL
jgi:hypothetical protein